MLRNISYLIARLAAVIIMGQTLYFKFSGVEESIYIFQMVGMEPWGRWLIGILELVACLLLLIPYTVWMGGVLSFALMAGAIGMHLTRLGIEVMGDNGQLFYYAIIVCLCGAFIMACDKDKIKYVIKR